MNLFLILCTFFTIFYGNTTNVYGSPFDATAELPCAYNGRFRPLGAASKLWLYQFYHDVQLKQSDLEAFHTNDHSALDLIWKIHLSGHYKFDDSQLFWIHHASLKALLNLPLKQDRFKFDELFQSIYENKETNLRLMQSLLLSEYLQQYHAPTNRTYQDKIELKNLSPGIWLGLKGDDLVVINAPSSPPWQFLTPGFVIKLNGRHSLSTNEILNKTVTNEALHLLNLMQLYSNYTSKSGDVDHALLARLRETGSTLKMLPVRILDGEWVSLHALNLRIYDKHKKDWVPIGNFTSFSDTIFNNIKAAYFEIQNAEIHSNTVELTQAVERFSTEMRLAYATLAETSYQIGIHKHLNYPSLNTLKVENLYYKTPLISIAIGFYFLALLICFAKRKLLQRSSLTFLIIAFTIHTAILTTRCYILQRPPVSNMFETIIYVPWIAMLIGFIFYQYSRYKFILWAAGFASLCLLITLKLTHNDAQLENVAAVLDSQYWLIIHVLMIVGSYGAFIIAGILGHLFLLSFTYFRKESQELAEAILYTIYIGVGLLIPGTILGGVWAAESWGRFWDWDPKESWAFISACTYILIIHAYRFRHIRDFGLAIGSIIGLMVISFTWYGVNYILGTGMHSYGFGQGGEWIYFSYLFIEITFLITMNILNSRNNRTTL